MVYVDDYRGRFRNMRMSHLLAGSPSELHEFAARLGLKRAWFRNGSAPHYDVSEHVRQKALRMGATDLPIFIGKRPNPEWLKVYRRLKARKTQGKESAK